MKKETASPVVSSSVSVINSNTSGGSLSSSAGAVSSTKLATESKHPPAKKSSFQVIQNLKYYEVSKLVYSSSLLQLVDNDN